MASFFSLEYNKTHFPCLGCLKKKHEKIANFGPKPWTNHFRKIKFFQLLVFIA